MEERACSGPGKGCSVWVSPASNQPDPTGLDPISYAGPAQIGPRMALYDPVWFWSGQEATTPFSNSMIFLQGER